MSLVLRMKDGDKTPTLYTHYGKQYDFDELQRSADIGFSDFLSSLKRGEKDQDKFREAYSNIMAGIKDGTITFRDGKYHDSLGRYTNSSEKNKNKDYYGLVANYIYGKQGKSKEYIKPEDKTDTRIKWNGNTGVGQAFLRNIYGSDNGNIVDFWDLDPYDSETNSRSLAGRLSKTKSTLEYLQNNFDSIFTGYSDSDKTQALSNLQDAISRISDSTIDPGDYLALSKALGGLDFRNMFTTNTGESAKQQTLQEQQQEGGEGGQLGFLEWVQEHYPQFTGSLYNPINIQSTRTYNQDVLNRLTQALKSSSNEQLFNSLRLSIADPNYNLYKENYISNIFGDADPGFTRGLSQLALLNALKNRNLLHSFGTDNPNIYYVPNTEGERQTSWVWDSKNNILREMSYHDIPYWRDKIYQEWLASQGVMDPSGYYSSRYNGYRFKRGGIIKAQSGVKLSPNANWYSGVFIPQFDHILSQIEKNPEYYQWINDMQDRHSEIYKSAGDNFQDKAYKNSIVGDYQNLYKQGFNNEWESNSAGYNSLGIQNAYNQGMFSINGTTIRTSGDWAGENNWKTDNLYSSITDYRRILGRKGDYTDEQLQSVKEALKERKYDIIEDSNGYYKLVPIKDQDNISPEVINENQEGELKKQTPATYISPTSAPEKKNSFSNFGQTLQSILPDIMGAARLAGSIRTNNKISSIIKKALNPVLENTYELYSPVTGAFSEMQLRNRQGADVQRRAAKPFTSDASLQLAGELEANRQANDLQYQGFLADDREILRTQQEALKRQEDNTARRSAVANKNRLSINKTNRERSELEATRLKQNWQSVDNFMQGIEGRLRTKIEQDRERRNNFNLQTRLDDIQQQYQDAISNANSEIEKFRSQNPGVSVTLMPGYKSYDEFIREALKWKNAQTYKAHADIYGYHYNNSYLSKSLRDMATSYGYYKYGGQLKPSILYLINKVIKNENNT